MADELVKVGIVAEDKTGPGVASAKHNLDSLGKSAVSASSSFNTLKAAAVGVGGAIAVMGTAKIVSGLTGMASGALQSYAAYERLGQSINALTAKQALLSGSATSMSQAMAQTKTQSKELLAWIEKLAIASPFRQDDVAQAFRLSMALGFSTKEAQRLTQAMLNFTTATGQGGETIERINRALGQMRTKGKVSLEEINQLTEAGVDAMRILRDATGKTGEALYKDISKGAISADFAINAIIEDTEKLYAGAGDAAATSMSGLLSSLSEVQDIIGRTLFTGVFEQMAGPLAALTTIVTAPEFKAGLESWSATLGTFTGDQLEAAAGAMERIDAAIQPLLNAGAPPWMVALQGIAAASGSDFKITVTPEVTSIKLPSAGLGIDITATATKLELGAGLPPVEIAANITPESAAIIESVLKAAGEGGAKGFGYELGVQTRKALQAQTGELGATFAAWGEQAKSNLDTALSTWQPVIGVTGTWINDTPAKLFAMAAQPFTEPIMMAGSWLPGALSSLWDTVQGWFNANPVGLNVKASVQVDSYTADTQPLGLPSGTTFGNDITLPAPSFNADPRYSNWNSPATSSTGGPTPKRNRAIGDGFFGGGLALVGEQGPELAVFPRGTQIYSNRDTRAMYGGSIPHFASGTGTPIPPGWGWLVNALRAAGGWIDRPMGPVTRADAGRGAWVDFTNQGVQAMQTAADRTGAAFEETAGKVNKTFESALQSVPGLFGTSQVTADDMRKSQLGLYQPKADEYLRQLSDEVLNGKEWGSNVDIKDAAKRAGIDPNLPNDIILELVKEAWNNSSLFAEGKNLDLINTDAVKAAIEQQQKQLSGQASLKALFGITDENLQAQSEALGQGLAAVFGGAGETDAVKASGTALMAGITAGLSDPTAASGAVAGMAAAMQTAQGTPANQTALYDNGYAAYGAWSKGFAAAAAAAPIPTPGGTMGPATNPAGRAVGTGFWQGGWMTVHANETIYAPRGTTVRNARESARGGGVTVINNVTVNKSIDEAAFTAKLMRQIRRAS